MSQRIIIVEIHDRPRPKKTRYIDEEASDITRQNKGKMGSKMKVYLDSETLHCGR